MADFCYYEIHVKGFQKACYAFLNSTPALDEYEILKETGSDNDFVIHYKGCCKVTLDYNCVDEYNRPINLEEYSLMELKENPDAVGLLFVIPKLKTKLLGVVAEISENIEGDGYTCFSRYNKGKVELEDEFFDEEPEVEEYEGDLIWDKDNYPDFEEFADDYNLVYYGIEEDEFVHSHDNVYIRPAKTSESSLFTF